MRRQETEIDYRARIERVSRHLEASLDAPATPAALAEVAGLSLHHFHRVFRGVTGESVEEHVRRLRLERAARQLRAADRAVAQLAIEAGYGSHEAFTRAFKERFGLAPSQYRASPSARLAEVARREPAEIEVTLTEHAAIEVACVRHVGPFSGIPSAFARLWEWAGRRGIDPLRAPALGLFYDDPEVTPAERLRGDVCVVCDEVPGAASGVSRHVVPAGLYATTLHHGPYDTLSATYLALIGRWLPGSRHEAADVPVVEVYLDAPGTVPVEAQRTEIRLLLSR